MNAIVMEPIGAHPCPFCGSIDLHIETDSLSGFAYNVECDNSDCNASGPCRMSQDDAIIAWNSAKR